MRSTLVRFDLLLAVLVAVGCAGAALASPARHPEASGACRASRISEAGATFTDINAGLPGVVRGCAVWGDYNSDGMLDVLMVGLPNGVGAGGEIASVYRSYGPGVFGDINAGLPGVYYSSANWGDYDNDGDLDILLAGISHSENIARVYRNDGSGVFTDINAGLEGVGRASVAWGDYDNDGRLDILIAGRSASGKIARVYRNGGAGVFTDINAGLLGVESGVVAWGDYDNDGHLDILLAGVADAGQIARVYRNDGTGAFTDINAGLAGVVGLTTASAAWGDYDNDGDLDILETSEYLSCIYRNDGANVFTQVLLPSNSTGPGAGGDYDNDGDLDILMGEYLLRNDGNLGFTWYPSGLPVVCYGGSVAWGDYDTDRDLDILLTGASPCGGLVRITNVYRSDGSPANTWPAAPGALSAVIVGNQLQLSWSPATDAETPSAGLSYNLRIGTTIRGIDILSPMSEPYGQRQVVQIGNAQMRSSWSVTLPPLRPYQLHWSVQTIDTGFMASAFASGTITDVEGSPSPPHFALYPNAPNPFNPSTAISFELASAVRVNLTILDVRGRPLRTLVDESKPAGMYTVIWDGTNDRRERMPSGVYLCRFEAGAFRSAERITLAK